MTGFAWRSMPSIEEHTMEKDLSRREFLERVGLGTAAGVSLSLLNELGEARPVAANPLPSRTLGRTGAKVSILAFGCGSRFLMYEAEEQALAALNRAIDLGIRGQVSEMERDSLVHRMVEARWNKALACLAEKRYFFDPNSALL
jgi:hypothetical protein